MALPAIGGANAIGVTSWPSAAVGVQLQLLVAFTVATSAPLSKMLTALLASTQYR